VKSVQPTVVGLAALAGTSHLDHWGLLLKKLVVITDVFEGEKIQEAGKPLAAGTWGFGLRWGERNHETGIL